MVVPAGVSPLMRMADSRMGLAVEVFYGRVLGKSSLLIVPMTAVVVPTV
jgi:hypothetical protein